MTSYPPENVAIAFAVSIGAGLSTAVGSSIVFFPSLISYANRKVLAGGMGLSAGVMIYVSFVEIVPQAIKSFGRADFQTHQSYNAATLCFFCGVALMVCLDHVVHGMADDNHITRGSSSEAVAKHHSRKKAKQQLKDTEESESSESNEESEEGIPTEISTEQNSEGHTQGPGVQVQPPCCAHDPNAQLEELKEMATKLAKGDNGASWGDLEAGINEAAKQDPNKKKIKTKKLTAEESRRLTITSINTAIAISLHNFPEGLATFVATLADPHVGVVLAVAIAIHNIPEGICVSLPVYYATGNRWKAFMWGFLSGISEPFAALLGYLVLVSVFNDIVYATLFGITAGMMVYMAVRELLPTAHRYDPEDSVVTNCFLVGMGVMAVSLVMFMNFQVG